MFVAMNRFSINPGREADFEAAWRTRESYLASVPGFVRFALLKGDEPGEYISHSTWESRAAFEAWTRSEAFRAAHSQAPMSGVLAAPPRLSVYEAVLTQEAPAPA
ncbi:antibiotic biosynthesis monooxygenase family protein [Tepidiforma thermophila]|uniref:Heme-degrading monooxygenase HmoA n=1 Tax=Tepidiforma thermophila (strain KCTC 52669 / CGMCC 1.13589 / G233) TaxID=2761530 RepID=A0A2A9HDF6_TEPT2|nr:antibiotic biosynthesis monooxygenase [Tepidiforma thermophila]PFG72839.1 heme-degrading monooxygenase HmoA [Tepidiforma thermophila]